MTPLLISFSILIALALWLFWRLHSLRSTGLAQGMRLRIRIDAFTGYGRRDSFYVSGRVAKDGGRLSALNAEFDLIGLGTKLRRNLRRFLLPEMEGVPLEIVVGGVRREATSGPNGLFHVHFEGSPILKTGSTIFSVRLHEDDRRFEANKAVAQIIIPSGSASIGIISDVDDTIVISHIHNRFRMFLHTFLTTVSDLIPTPGFSGLLTTASKGSSGHEENPVFYVSGSPVNLYDKLHAFLRANRFPIGPLFLTSLGVDRNAGFFQQRIFKAEQIRTILSAFPELRFVLLGDNGQFDSDIYHQISLEFPGRIAAVLIYETVSPLKADRIIPLGQHRIANALEGGLVLYRRGLVSREGLEAIVNELKMENKLPDSFNLERRLRQIQRRDRAQERRLTLARHET